MSLPLFLAVLPSITLSRVPDPDADEAVGKRTLSRCGPGCAAPVRSPRCSPCWQPARRSRCNRCRGSGRCSPASSTALPHALLLLWLLARQARLAPQAQRIDRLMVVALAYILWFVGVPLAHPA